MEAQAATAVLLVRPAGFGFNAEAAKTNVFSHDSADPELGARALAEFDAFTRVLADSGVEVLILDDTASPSKPDAVFPNNWMSTHSDGTIVLYPMATAPRRFERRIAEVQSLLERHDYDIRRIVDLSREEDEGRFLEGTGSLVLDRPRRRGFANRSPRTNAHVVGRFDEALGYSTLMFDACDPGGRPIYHTNVLLGLGTDFAVLCIEAIVPRDRERVVDAIKAGGRTIIETSFAQLRRFGCNLLELRSASGETVIALSAKALASFRSDQLRALERFGRLVAADVPTIEAVGGGSVRCMIAEVHLPRRKAP